MFPPFETKDARSYCLKLISQIEAGNIILKQITQDSKERKDNGLMLGTLICKEKVLFCVSGIHRQLQVINNPFDFDFVIVPPLADNQAISKALEENDRKIHELTDKINAGSTNLTEERRKLTDQSLQKVFSLYNFYKSDNTNITLDNIILRHGGKLPPTGTGDCCAPKLLSYAYEHNYTPLSMDEVFYGKNTKNKINLQSYPPCTERCDYILPDILGLDIIYRDDYIIVVNKPSMLLSVPGRTPDKQDCIVNRVKKLYPFCIEQPSVHRLDMETSGLMVLAFTKEAHKNLNLQFEKKLVEKAYTALLDGALPKSSGELSPHGGEKSGRIELKFRLDINNRPHQIYDEENGKLGITEWQLLNIEKYTNPISKKEKTVSRMLYRPLTGRTHQLRLISSDPHGFNLPIVGDSLYGKCEEGERLMLHCHYLSFIHPVTNEKMEFNLPCPF